MRLPNSGVGSRRLAISRIAPDFKLLDVWALPAEGSFEEFSSFVALIAAFDPADADSAITRALFAVRHRLGAWLGWDDATKDRTIPGSTQTTLKDRVPGELEGTAQSSAVSDALRHAGFTPLYQSDDEWAGEISNDTVHGVLHFAWVERDDGRYRAEMRIYVKPRGLMGEVYMKLIQPFRHLIVYPALVRQIGRAWAGRDVER